MAVTCMYSSPTMLSPLHHHLHTPCNFSRRPQHTKHRQRLIHVRSDADIKEGAPLNAHHRSEADKLVDMIQFGELCNEFKCISSPSVEASARQLARDILEIREENKVLEVYAISVKYKDPLRSFTGREKYKRPSWIKKTLSNPSVTVKEMKMLSTSSLNVKWIVKGKPKVVNLIIGDFNVIVNSTYTLNQISGQVLEHVEEWDLSTTSGLGQAFFWISQLFYSTTASGNDLVDTVNERKNKLFQKEESRDGFSDPSTDPTKFFQMEPDPLADVYQVGLVLAFLYFIVQFLSLTL